MVEAVCVDPKRVHEIWPRVKPLIQQAYRRGDLGLFGDIEDDALNGDALVWLAWQEPTIEAAAVTQITITERSKVCMIRACGGSQVRRWVHLLETIEAYAKSQRCNSVRLMGRKGWQRILKNYSATRIILERRL